MSLPLNGPVAVSDDAATNNLALLYARLEGHRSRCKQINKIYADYTSDLRKRRIVLLHGVRRLEALASLTSNQEYALQIRRIEVDTLQGKLSAARKARDEALAVWKREIDALRIAIRRRQAVAPKPE